MASNKVAEYAKKMREKKLAEEQQKGKAGDNRRRTAFSCPSPGNLMGGGSGSPSVPGKAGRTTLGNSARSSGTRKDSANATILGKKVATIQRKSPDDASRLSSAAGNGSGSGSGSGSSEGKGMSPAEQAMATAAVAEQSKKRQQRERMLAQHRTPPEVQTFTMDHFVQGVVEWDIFGEIHAEANGNRSTWEETDGLPNISVPNSFRSAQEYARVWTPLLVREVRAQTLSELCGSDGWQKQMVMEVKVADSASLTGRDDLKLSDIHPEFEELIVGKKVKTSYGGGNPQCFTEHELLLFMVEPDAIKTAISGKGAKSPKGFLGVVSSATRTREGLALRVSTDMLKRHRPKDRKMYCMALGSLRPTLREYDSITGLGRVMLRNNLLSGQATKTTGNLADNLGGPFVEWLEHKFNDSQKQAIRAGASSHGFTLIKGPPGTGKTTTLKALLNALHQREYNRYYDKLLNLARVAPEETPAAWDRLKNFAPHILITAPSNVAVDNIVSRILDEGFLDGNAGRYNPSMVRVGSGNVGTQVRPVALSGQVSDALKQTAEAIASRVETVSGTMINLRDTINRTLQLLRVLIAACPHEIPFGWEARVNRDTFQAFFVDHANQRTTMEPPDPPTPGPDVRTVAVESMPEYRVYAQHLTKDLEMYERLNKEHKRLNFAARAQTEHREHAVRQSLEVTLLDEAHLVFSTLNSSGLPCMDHTAQFEVLVVDEAAQSVEVSTIIPLRLGCRHCVLVGDPNQLPATVFSQGGKLSQYDRSLFQRLEANNHPVQLLDTQYRMHPTISAFPSATFYDNKLKDGGNVSMPAYTRAFHTHPIFQPFMFFDLTSGAQSRRGGGSLSNTPEAYLALNVYLTLKRAFGGIGPSGSGDEHGIAGRVGVISPYAQQINVLRDTFQSNLGHGWKDEVEISTVDAFQGREKDVIIVSTVRAAGSRGIGFLADVRRMNVALTRARHGLFVVGSARALSVNPKWSELVELAKTTEGLVTVTDAKCDLMQLSPVRVRGARAGSPVPGTTKTRADVRMLPFGTIAQAPEANGGVGAGAGAGAGAGTAGAGVVPFSHEHGSSPPLASLPRGVDFSTAMAAIPGLEVNEGGGTERKTLSPPPMSSSLLPVMSPPTQADTQITRNGTVDAHGMPTTHVKEEIGRSSPVPLDRGLSPPPSSADPLASVAARVGVEPVQLERPPLSPPRRLLAPAASAPPVLGPAKDTSQISAPRATDPAIPTSKHTGASAPRPPSHPRPRPPATPRVASTTQQRSPKAPSSLPVVRSPAPPPPPRTGKSPPLSASVSGATETAPSLPLTTPASAAAAAKKSNTPRRAGDPRSRSRPRPPAYPRGVDPKQALTSNAAAKQSVPEVPTPTTPPLPPPRPPPPPPPRVTLPPAMPVPAIVATGASSSVTPTTVAVEAGGDSQTTATVQSPPLSRSPPPRDPRKRDRGAAGGSSPVVGSIAGITREMSPVKGLLDSDSCTASTDETVSTQMESSRKRARAEGHFEGARGVLGVSVGENNAFGEGNGAANGVALGEPGSSASSFIGQVVGTAAVNTSLATSASSFSPGGAESFPLGGVPSAEAAVMAPRPPLLPPSIVVAGVVPPQWANQASVGMGLPAPGAAGATGPYQQQHHHQQQPYHQHQPVPAQILQHQGPQQTPQQQHQHQTFQLQQQPLDLGPDSDDEEEEEEGLGPDSESEEGEVII